MGIWPAVLTAVLWTVGTIWLVRLILRDEIRPALAPWIIFSTTMLLGLISFSLAPKATVASGIGFFAGLISTLPVITSIIYMILKEKREVTFNRFQKGCLSAADGIVIAWMVMKFVMGGPKAAFVANILTQVLMVIGYTALAERLWLAKTRVDSLFFWTMISLGSAFATIIPISQGNTLGIVFGIRGFVTAGVAVALLIRIEWRVRRVLQSAS